MLAPSATQLVLAWKIRRPSLPQPVDLTAGYACDGREFLNRDEPVC